MRLIYTPPRAVSSPGLDAGDGCYKTGSSQRGHGSHAGGFQSDADACIAL